MIDILRIVQSRTFGPSEQPDCCPQASALEEIEHCGTSEGCMENFQLDCNCKVQMFSTFCTLFFEHGFNGQAMFDSLCGYVKYYHTRTRDVANR